jgi:hypothetical protein
MEAERKTTLFRVIDSASTSDEKVCLLTEQEKALLFLAQSVQTDEHHNLPHGTSLRLLAEAEHPQANLALQEIKNIVQTLGNSLIDPEQVK